MINSFAEIINDPLLNQNSILRWSSKRCNITESVSTHVSECIGIAILFWNHTKSFSLKDLIYKISLHDIGEVFTGDLIRPVKYHNDTITKEINNIEFELIKSHLGDDLAKEVLVCKDNSVEGYLCSYIDVLQASFKIIRELDLSRTSYNLKMLEYNKTLLMYKLLEIETLDINELTVLVTNINKSINDLYNKLSKDIIY